MRTLAIPMLFAAVLTAQTAVNGSRVFLGEVDASASTRLRIKTGAGLPAATDCNSIVETGSVYSRSEAQAPNSTLYVCSQTGSGVFAWELVGAGGAGTAFNPHDSSQLWLVEEFQSGGTTTGLIGANGLRLAALGTGVSVAYLNTATNTILNHPGVLSCTTGAAVGSGCGLALANTSTTANINTSDLATKDWEIQAVVLLPATADVRLRIGWASTDASVVPASGFWVRYDTSSTFADSAWTAQLCNSCATATESSANRVVALANPPAPAAWARIRLRRSGGTYFAQVNGEPEVSFCATGCSDLGDSMPSNTGWSPTIVMVSDIAAARTLWIDRLSVSLIGLTRY